MKGLIILFTAFLFSCSSNDKSVKDCGLSRITSIDSTAFMDTITVNARGSIVDACTEKGISAYVKFKNNDYRFDFVSDSSGKFHSLHMPAGTYLFSSKQKKYRSLPDTLITLKSGQVMDINLALAPE